MAGAEICQIYFWPMSCMCFHPESISLHQASRTGSACTNSVKNVCYKREAKTGNAFDFVALMPRLDDVGEKKPPAGLALKMPVQSTHPDYDANLVAWQRARDGDAAD
jgi:hypothetical protein